jgi:predicted Zn-dependent peptidase
VLGTRESIGNLARDQMLDYFRLRYAPDNLTLVAVGQLDFEQLVRTAEDLCGGWEPAGTKRQTPPCTGSGRRETITDAKLNRQNIGLMNGAPSWQDERRFAAELLAHILGDSTGSRLYYALIEPGLADEAHCAYHALDGEGILMTYLSTAPEQASRAAEIVREEYRTFIEQGPTPQELEAAKNKIASSLTIRGEMPMGRLSAVGQEWVYRREYVPLRDQVEAIFAVTDRQVRRLAEGCRLPDATALALGPQENPWP